MSKRFVSTLRWDHPWFRRMPSAYREFWGFICDKCDNAGVWRKDIELAAMLMGAPLTEEEALIHFKDRVLPLNVEKWFIPSFVEFQYGVLKPDCPPHKSVIRTLLKHGIDPQTLTLSLGLANPNEYNNKSTSKGINTLQEKEKDKDKEEDKDKEKETSLTDQIRLAWEAWCETLAVFEIPAKYISPADQTILATSIKRNGFARTINALIGKRYEEKQNGYDPARTLSLSYCLMPGPKGNVNHERLENLALQQESAEQTADENLKAEQVARHGAHVQ